MTEKRVLVIDDERTFSFPATYARTLPEGAWLLFTKGMYPGWDEVWLDHDLGDTQYRMMDLLNAIEIMSEGKELLTVHRFIIHSANPVARNQMAQALSGYPLMMVRAEDYIND
jgi:hypothetical protein